MSQTVFNAALGGGINTNTTTTNNWATFRAIPSNTLSGGGSSTTEIIAQCLQSGGGGGEYYGYHGFVTFDTSSLADNATISSATLALYSKSKDPGHNQGFYILGVTMGANTSLTSTDYNITNFSSATQNLAVGQASVNTSAWNNFAIAAGYISKTAYTKLGLVQSNDWLNEDPPDYDNDVYIFDAQTNIPTLTITWTTPPVVTTGSATSITATTATLGGNITDAGGGTVSTAGVCWGTSTNPTTSNSKTATSTTSGAFTVAATGLISGVLYHYRSYVTTENSTTYGADTTFRTIFGGNFIPFI